MSGTERSQGDIKGLVEKLRDDFRSLTTLEQRWITVEDNTYDYAKEIPETLGDPVVIGGGISTQLCEQIIAALTNPRRPNVYIPKSGPTADNAEDEMEAFFAHCFQRMDPRGDIDGGISDNMTRRRFAAVMLKLNAKNPPKRGKEEPEEAYKRRKDLYERQYWRWGAELLDPEAVAVLPNGTSVSTVVVALRKRIIDFAAEFGQQKGDDEKPHEMWGRQFPWVKASDGSAYDSQASGWESWSQKYIDYFVIDDGNWIHVYCEDTTASGDRDGSGRFIAAGTKRYKDAVEPYKNTFGRPSVILFVGRHRPHAKIERRYEALAAPIFLAERDIVLTDSLIATMAANRRWIEPPPDQGSVVSGNSEREVDFTTKDGKAGVPQTDAEWQDVSNTVAEAWTNLQERNYNRLDRITAHLQLQVPSPEMVEKSTAASITFGAEAAQKPFGRANRSISTGYQQICEMIAHDIVYGLNAHLLSHGPQKANDRPIEFDAIGTEVTRKPVKKGDHFTIAPDRFLPGAFEVRMEIVGTSQAQQAAQTQLEMAKLTFPIPLTTPDKVLEAAGVSNVSERMREIATYQRSQLTSVQRTNMAIRDAIEEVALVEQRDRNQLYMLAAPQLMPVDPSAGGTGPRGPSYIPPAQPQATDGTMGVG